MKRLFGCMVAVLMALVVSAHGAARYVSSVSGVDTGTGTSPTAPCRTIQYAVDQSGSGDEIRIAKYDVVLTGIPPTLQTNACVYTGTGAAVISLPAGKSLTLKGGYLYLRASGTWQQGVLAPLVNGQNARRGLYAAGGDNDTNRVELLEFANGAAADGANVYAAGGSLQLVGTPIHGGVATGNGGGLYMSGVDFSVSLGSYSNLALPQMTGLLPIYGNRAARGGGLYLDGGYPVLTTVGIMNNTATGHGGGVYIKGGVPSVVGGTIRDNAAAGNGGAIYLTNSVARVGGMLVSSNRAARGGAFYLDGPFALTMETATLIANNYIRYNAATNGPGGGFFFNRANVGIVNNVIANNTATDGAAAYLYASSPRFFQNTIADNAGSTALHVTHDDGEGWSQIIPPVLNPFTGKVVVPGKTNLFAGIPVPSWPAFTNTIVSGQATALRVDSTGNGMIENKVQMGYTLWWNNATNVAGSGTVNRHDDLEADPLYTGKGTQPSDMTPYHVATNSPAVDAGTEVGLTLPGTDLLLDIDAQLRPSGEGMDIGADEVANTPFSVWFVPSAIAVSAKPGDVVTNRHMLLNSGTMDDTFDLSRTNSQPWASTLTPTTVALASQTYTTIVVRITIPPSAPYGTTNLTTVTARSRAEPTTLAAAADVTSLGTNAPGAGTFRYVWQDSPNPGAPYTTWDSAGHEIQTVVDACGDGDTVVVAAGSYGAGGRAAAGTSLTNRVCATNDVAIVGMAGATSTFILGKADPAATNGPGAVRGAYLTGGARLDGFTILDGHTRTDGDAELDRSGGGVLMNGSAGLSNCVVQSCSSARHGGGVFAYRGTVAVRDCVLRGNRAAAFGGGGYFVDPAAVEGCEVLLNAGGSYAGGLAVGANVTVQACIVSSNTADWGGGLLCGGGSVVTGTEVRGNRAASGGGAWCNASATLENSLLAGNLATSEGGGVYFSGGAAMRNCTVAGNTAPSAGGALCLSSASIQNTILYENTGGNWILTSRPPAPVFMHCCATPFTGGTGSFTNRPAFEDAAGGNYRLASTSPCVDAGGLVSLVVAADPDGTPRPLDGDAGSGAAFDIGAYERFNPAGNSDGDPASDGEEVTADTDFTDAGDYFHVAAVSNLPPWTVYFESSARRVYTLRSAASLTNAVWADVPGAGPRLGVGGPDWLQDTNAPQRGPFYRVGVETP